MLEIKICIFFSSRRQIIGGTLGHEMILKVRVAGNDDPDYIEIELPGDSLSLEALILTASRYVGPVLEI